jgi:hypothetical protein
MFRPLASIAVPAASGIVAFAALTGCNPTTTYRYTALTPAARPIPWDGRAANGGELRVEGSISKDTVFEKSFPQLHDTALHVPGVTAEGSISIAPIRNFEIGIRGAYSAYAWSQASIDGTEPLPSHPAVWGIGPELKGTINIDKKRRFAIGIAGNIMRYETPYSEWSLTGPGSANGQTTECSPSPTCTIDPATLNGAHYKLFDEKSESHLTMSLGIYPSFDFTGTGEYGHVFGVLAGTTGFENDGFTDTAQNGSTLTGFLFVPIRHQGRAGACVGHDLRSDHDVREPGLLRSVGDGHDRIRSRFVGRKLERRRESRQAFERARFTAASAASRAAAATCSSAADDPRDAAAAERRLGRRRSG